MFSILGMSRVIILVDRVRWRQMAI